MGETSNQYIKFMSDIIDSGLWGKLSPAAKTLYPVLLKFSDQNLNMCGQAQKHCLSLQDLRPRSQYY